MTMFRRDRRTGDEGAAEEDGQGYALVCALCEGRLPGRLETRARADEAADDHVLEQHPDRAPVAVLAVPLAELEVDDRQQLTEAKKVQRQLDGVDG